MSTSRREFLLKSSALATGFFALRELVHNPALGYAAEAAADGAVAGYGPLMADAAQLLDLPAGFTYKIIARCGDPMSDGLVTPAKPDGMATFAGPDGLTIIVRNHEMLPYQAPGAFGESDELAEKVDRNRLYDLGDKRIHRGGTSTIVYDTKKQEMVRSFLSLGGTARNCAGGPTPWNSWVTCEEVVVRPGETIDDGGQRYQCLQEHGYPFEVPATADIRLHAAVPLKGMGRFNHEAIAVDPASGVVYETEDRDNGLIYRYLPNKPGRLAEGGKLQALVLKDWKSADTRRWSKKGRSHIDVGGAYAVEWMDVDEIESPNDDLRQRGHDAGAACFARGEGMWYAGGQIYFACTNGGETKKGQIWRYVPSAREGEVAERGEPGALELFIEPNDSALIESADNLTAAPWGDMIVCEDREGPIVRLVGVTPRGECYTLARNHGKLEFAGVCFSPDGSTLFVNIQHEGLTLAITGPWQARS